MAVQLGHLTTVMATWPWHHTAVMAIQPWHHKAVMITQPWYHTAVKAIQPWCNTAVMDIQTWHYTAVKAIQPWHYTAVMDITNMSLHSCHGHTTTTPHSQSKDRYQLHQTQTETKGSVKKRQKRQVRKILKQWWLKWWWWDFPEDDVVGYVSFNDQPGTRDRRECSELTSHLSHGYKFSLSFSHLCKETQYGNCTIPNCSLSESLQVGELITDTQYSETPLKIQHKWSQSRQGGVALGQRFSYMELSAEASWTNGP